MSDLILPARAGRRTRKLGAIWTWLVAALLLGSLLSVGVGLSVLAQEPTSGAVGIHKVQGASWAPGMNQPLFIGVLGSDARSGPPNAGGGCDAIHIVAINPQLKAGTILNFPRDSYLGGRKLTDICRQSGFEAAIQVLKGYTGIPIQYYVRTEFSHFRALIDELGGIDVNVPYAMNDPDSGAVFGQGPIHLNGAGALAFTRNRKHTPNGDFSRTDNQGLLIMAALVKFRADVSEPHRILDYIRAGRRHVSPSIPVIDLMRMAFIAREIDPIAIRNHTIGGSTGSAGGASVVFPAPADAFDRVRDDAIY